MEQTVESIESTTEEFVYTGNVKSSGSPEEGFSVEVDAQGKLPVLVIKQSTYAILWTPNSINSTLFEKLKTLFINNDPSLSNSVKEWYQISGYGNHDLRDDEKQFDIYTFVQTANGVQFICPADRISHLSYGTYKTIETSSKTLYSYEIQYALPTYVLKGNVKTYRKDTLTSYIVKWEYTSKKSTDV